MGNKTIKLYEKKKKKTVPIYFNEKSTILCAFFISYYSILVNIKQKKKHSLPFHITNNELK